MGWAAVVIVACLTVIVAAMVGVLLPKAKPVERKPFTIPCNACGHKLGPFLAMPQQVQCPNCHAIIVPPEVAMSQAWPQIVFGIFTIGVSLWLLWMLNA